MEFLKRHRTLLMIWLAWALIMVGYQFYVRARFEPARPDYATSWTHYETLSNSQNDQPYLRDPFLNQHVAWDSEYYLSIAMYGYDDPAMRAIPESFSWQMPRVRPKGRAPEWISMSHAFFPFYPYVMRAVMIPLSIFGLSDIATATLAGVLVSMAGTLAAMLALHDLARDAQSESDGIHVSKTGIRAAFYLLIFPASMFLAEVYTEGLFLGLAFSALAFARRERWLFAALCAVCATWTRAAGGMLILPMGVYWLQASGFSRLIWERSRKELINLSLIASPSAA